jgi:hypothetical protein
MAKLNTRANIAWYQEPQGSFFCAIMEPNT